VACEISGKVITIHLQVSGDCRVAIAQAGRKDALLVRKAARKIQYQC